MNSLLDDLLSNIAAAKPHSDAFFASYGMSRNPFPPARTIYPEVIYNQEDALRRFAAGMAAVLGDGITRRSMGVLGETGQGKSHFQRHCQHVVRSRRLPIVAVEFLAGTGSAQILVREIYRAADEHVREANQLDLLTAIIIRAADNGLGPVRQSDLRSALTTLMRASRADYVPQDQNQRFDFQTLVDTCRRWLVGETLTQTEKRWLRVSGRLSSGSLMVRVMTELFALARSQDLFEGVMLCLDEVEAIFSSGVPTARIQAFLQDVRYLFDEALGQSSGYSLMVLSGSTGRGASFLANYNYPLFQRLGFEGEARVSLHQVQSVEEARLFANVYLLHEYAETAGANATEQGRIKALTLVDQAEIERAFLGPGLAAGGDQRSQARLLEELHRIVEAKREAAVEADDI